MTFKRKDSLLKHKHVCRENPDLFPIECGDCNRRFKSEIKLKTHKKSFNPKYRCKKYNKSEDMFCSMCQKSFVSGSQAKIHMETFHSMVEKNMINHEHEQTLPSPADKPKDGEQLISNAKNVINEMMNVMGVEKVIDLINTM